METKIVCDVLVKSLRIGMELAEEFEGIETITEADELHNRLTGEARSGVENYLKEKGINPPPSSYDEKELTPREWDTRAMVDSAYYLALLPLNTARGKALYIHQKKETATAEK